VRGKGFGKANRLISQVTHQAREKMAKEWVDEVTDPGTLTGHDWAYLAKDTAVMAGVFIEHEVAGFECHGSHYYQEENGTVTGLTFLTHRPTEENVGLVLQQVAVGVPEWHCVEVFTTVASGVTAVPEGDLDAASAVAERTLNREAVAFTVSFDGAERGVLAGYAFDGAHAQEKAELLVPKGSKRSRPVYVSIHPNTTTALAFAYQLNKRCGVLFGGVPYSDLATLLNRKGEE
jgi:hypothetical protein